MKRSRKSNEQVQKFPKTASPTADSRAVVVNKTQEQVDELSLITRNQEELVDELSLITRQATGTQSHDVADRIIEQVAGVHVWPRPKDASDQVIQAVLTMAEMGPQNATEAMLAVQMIAANDAALLFLRRATADGQTVEGSDGNVLRATRLMRLFTEQLAAMAKLKGKTGQQKVVVEHVMFTAEVRRLWGRWRPPTRSRRSERKRLVEERKPTG